MVVPRGRSSDFEAAATSAIDALYSKEFEQALESFMAAHAADAGIRDAWAGTTSMAIAASLRSKVVGVDVSTFGGIKGAYYGIFKGTVAFERASEEAPVRFNRWGLANRSSAQIANTIAHEVAHAAGLRHPHSDGDGQDWTLARCEPPYVIGSIVERLSAGATWRWSTEHCEHLK